VIQSVLTVVVPLKRRCEQDVANLLQSYNDRAGPVQPAIAKALAELGIVHFLSMSVIPASDSGPAHLFWEAAVDGAPADALQRLARALGRWLHDLAKAAGVPEPGLADLPAFFQRHSRSLGSSWWQTGLRTNRLGLTFCGAPGATAARIVQEGALAARISDMTRELGGPDPAMKKLSAVRDTLWNEGEWKWAFLPLEVPFLAPSRPRTRRVDAQIAAASVPALLWPGLAAMLAVALLTYAISRSLPWAVVVGVIYGIAAASVALLTLRYRETTDAIEDKAPVPADVARIMQDENQSAINLTVLVSTMKPGEFRRLTLRAALWIVGQVVSRTGIPGFLGEIGVVHFLQWALLPDSNQLIFISHYDGSWASYLEDFINLVPQGPSAIWSNCAGFPRTRFLFFDGATDGDRFRQYARRQQIPAGFWYAAYPDLTLERIRINARIRRGLATACTDTDARSWLALFGAPST
jgi:hypothetical protein